MNLHVDTDLRGANACGITTRQAGSVPEISLAPDPKGGTQALWFSFRMRDSKPNENQGGKIAFTLRHLDVWGSQTEALDLLPVYRPEGQGWHRCSGGTLTTEPDGRFAVTWLLPHPAPETDVALCFPYGPAELKTLMAKSKGYWNVDEIGRSEDGLPIKRWANEYGAAEGRKSGIYLIAREHAGETPGSWVLDGLLQHMARVKRDPFLIWAIPLADPDALERGVHGRSTYPLDVDRAWSQPPLRHEIAVYQQDILRWSQRCKPALGLEFHAATPFDKSGVRCVLPDAGRTPEQHRAAEKWANLIRQELGPNYAAADFKREDGPRSDPAHRTATHFFAEHAGVGALALQIPYSRIGTKVLAQRQYREMGEAIAKALMKKA